MPHIKDFVDKVKEEPIPGFEIDYKQGAPPILHLYEADGWEGEPISIAQWKSEHIREFLVEKLKAA